MIELQSAGLRFLISLLESLVLSTELLPTPNKGIFSTQRAHVSSHLTFPTSPCFLTHHLPNSPSLPHGPANLVIASDGASTDIVFILSVNQCSSTCNLSFRGYANPTRISNAQIAHRTSFPYVKIDVHQHKLLSDEKGKRVALHCGGFGNVVLLGFCRPLAVMIPRGARRTVRTGGTRIGICTVDLYLINY